MSCLSKQEYLKNKISTNKDSVSREHIQKGDHRANIGRAYLSTVQKKGSFGCQRVLSRWYGRPSRAWGWMHGVKNQKIQQISEPISSKLVTLKWMHQKNLFFLFFLFSILTFYYENFQTYMKGRKQYWYKVTTWQQQILQLCFVISAITNTYFSSNCKNAFSWSFKISLLVFSHSVMSDFVTPWTAAPQTSLSFIISQSFLKFVSIELVMPSNHLILCWPLLLLPSILSSIRGFSNESVLHIRWPKYWSCSFSISPSSEYSGLISFRMDWLDLLAVRGTLKSFLQHHSSKTSILQLSV